MSGRSDALGFSILVDFVVAALAALLAIALGYLFSQDLRRLILAQMNRARVVLGSLANRAKPSPPINPNAQK
ncbi:MAG TPA: hypothetical protein VGG86_08845 [Roseiarcus sp.]|jgi:hypothetical protein